MPSSLAANAARFTFTAGGRPFHVAAFTASEQISGLFEVQLKLASTDIVAAEEVVGKPGLLTIESREQERYLHGIVHSLYTTGAIGRFNRYEAVVVPQAALLAHRRDCRIFQHQSVPDIVTQVLRQAGMTGDRFSFRLQGTYASHHYCVQYRESDLHFIRRLLAEEGIFFFFEHGKDGHIMVFGDSTVNYAPIAGSETVPFNPGGGTVAETEAVLAFKRGRRIVSDAYTQRDFNFEKPALDLTARHQSEEHRQLEIYDYPGAYDLPEPGARLAKIRLEAAAMHRVQAMGKSVVARFAPGFTFTLTDGPADGHDGPYLITRIAHTGQQPQVLAEMAHGDGGTVYANDFSALPAGVPFRTDGDDLRKPIVRGVQTAIVTGPTGEEIYTDRHGRIKVQFHWDRQGKKDENSSCWIRVSQGWAGAGWGAVHIPRIGQEVIVDFIEGDPDRPIVTGRVYHGTNAPPYALPQHKTRSTVKSRTTPGGNGSNEIRFEDKKGAEEIFLHGQKDWNIAIQNDKGQRVGRDESLDVAHNRTKTVGANQAETIDADKRIEVGGHHTESIRQNADISIDGELTRSVGKNAVEKIGRNLALNVSQNSEEKVGGRKRIDVGKSFEIHTAGQIFTMSDNQIRLESGGAALVIKSSGEVMIEGTRISMKASGAITLKGAKVITD